MRKRSTVALLLTTTLLVAVVHAREEWYDHYQEGLDALAAGRSEEAIAALERALDDKSRSGYLRTYGNNYIHYAPLLHLGLAYHQSGDCPRALEYFDESQVAGEGASDAALAEQRALLRSECEERTRPAPPVAPPVEIPPASPAVEPLQIDAVKLERGIEAYLDGRFDEAVAHFESLVAAEPRSPRLFLFLGASLHGAWSAGGEGRGPLLDRATAALRSCGDLGGARSADPALFPPRVLALLRSLR